MKLNFSLDDILKKSYYQFLCLLLYQISIFFLRLSIESQPIVIQYAYFSSWNKNCLQLYHCQILFVLKVVLRIIRVCFSTSKRIVIWYTVACLFGKCNRRTKKLNIFFTFLRYDDCDTAIIFWIIFWMKK